MKQGPFPPAGLCCPGRQAVLRPPPTPWWPPATSRWLPVIGALASRTPQARGHRGPLQFPRHPSDHSTPPTPEGSLAPAPGSLVPSMAFATGMQARLPLGPLARGFLTTPQASLDAADWPVAPRPASTPGSRPTPGAALPGTLASPRTGLTPAGCRELVARLRRGAPPFGGPRRPRCWTHIPAESPGVVLAAGRPGSGRPGGGVDAGPRRPGQGQGPPQAVPQARQVPLTRPARGVGSAGWPRQRPVRGRGQGPGRGAGTADEAVP